MTGYFYIQVIYLIKIKILKKLHVGIGLVLGSLEIVNGVVIYTAFLTSPPQKKITTENSLKPELNPS